MIETTDLRNKEEARRGGRRMRRRRGKGRVRVMGSTNHTPLSIILYVIYLLIIIIIIILLGFENSKREGGVARAITRRIEIVCGETLRDYGPAAAGST